MSSPRVLVDTGPLVAFLREAEASHAWAAAQFAELPAPFFTSEPVLAETFFLVSRQPDGPRRFFDLLGSGVLEIDFSVLGECDALWKLIRKYEDLPMSLADACLVRLIRLMPEASVFTFDSDFSFYRAGKNRVIQLVAPFHDTAKLEFLLTTTMDQNSPWFGKRTVSAVIRTPRGYVSGPQITVNLTDGRVNVE